MDNVKQLRASAAPAVALALSSALGFIPASALSASLLAESVPVSAFQTNTFDFNAPGAGTLDVQLTDLDWNAALASLTTSIDGASSVLGMLQSPGTLMLSVSGPSQLSAFVTAQAQGMLNLGAYSLDVTFTPLAPVPLPAAGLLLVAGVGLLGRLGWRRTMPDG